MRMERTGSFPLSAAQESLWEHVKHLHAEDPGAAAMNLVGTAVLPGNVDLRALRAALDEVTARHEPLRTRFAGTGLNPRLTLTDHRAPLLVDDLGGVPPGDRANRLTSLLVAAGRRRFDLLGGPLWTAGLVRRSRAGSLLVVTLFPLVGDELSIGLIVDEVRRCYLARIGRGPALAPLPATYRMVVNRQERQRAVGDDELGAWSRRLLPLPSGPRVQVRPGSRAPVPALRTFTLPAVTRLRLTRLTRWTRATPFVVLLAGYAAALASRSGADRVVIGTPTPGRDVDGADGLVGRFADHLYVEIRMSAGLPVHRFLDHVRLGLIEAARVSAPFKRVAALVHPGFADDRPWPFVHLVHAWFGIAPPAGTTRTLHAPPAEVLGSQAPGLVVNAALDGGHLAYDSRHLDPAEAGELADRYVRVIGSIVADPRLPLDPAAFARLGGQDRLSGQHAGNRCVAAPP